MSPLPLDGERLIPDAQKGSRDHRDHMARYTLASVLVAQRYFEINRDDISDRASVEQLVEQASGGGVQLPRRVQVLDVACGEGYGTAMLQRVGGDAWGADISPRVVAHAQEKYGSKAPEDRRPAPAFFQADVRDLPWGWAGKFDFVVSFETIEHVLEWDDTLRSLERVRAPGGFLVISTPNRGVYGAGNPYHKHEVTAERFEELLRERYPWVAMMRQVEMPTSLLVESSSTAAVTELRLSLVDQLPPAMYAVAVCGERPIDVPAVGVV